MKRPVLLLLANAALTIVVTLGLIHWLAPQLLGRPVDLQVVQLDEKVPPFYEAVFANDGRVRNDPLTGTRMNRLLAENEHEGGPFDILGFRNRAVPIVADVVAIGDSQTVGRNATLDWSWPARLAAHLPAAPPSVYGMASGGWGPVQYLYVAEKALSFRPHVIAVAFYTGNDAYDAVKIAYNLPAWAGLRASSEPPPDPPAAWPPRASDLWELEIAKATPTVLTPRARLMSNDRSLEATREGYRIMAEVGRRIGAIARRGGAHVVFTIIPTKELVYAEAIRREGVAAPPEYAQLVADEAENVSGLAAALASVAGATYVDVVRPLQAAAAAGVPLYPPNQNGHPISPGYDLIARELAPAIGALVPAPPRDGLVVIAGEDAPTDAGVHALERDGGLWHFASPEDATGNGWSLDDALPVTPRDVAHLEDRGYVLEVDPFSYGPASLAPGDAARPEVAPGQD